MSLALIVLATLYAALMLIVLTRPLWQKKLSARTLADSERPMRTLENVEAYRGRIAEIETAFQSGRISEIEKQNLETELKRTFLADNLTADVENPMSALSVSKGPQWGLTAIISMVFLVCTFAGYWHWGRYQDMLTWQKTQQRLQPQITKALADPELLLELFRTESTRDVILSYQRNLLSSADNPVAWMALSRILRELDRDALAQQAVRKAYQQAPHEPGYALELAQLIIESNEGKLTAESDHLLKKLQLDHPQDPRVLMLLGAAYLKNADWSRALSAFQKLQNQLSGVDMGEQGPLVKERVAGYIAQSQQGLAAASVPADSEKSSAAAVNIEVLVSIDPGSLAAWKRTETLWVFAKVPDGPRFPVAAKKVLPTQWPVKLTLSDADAMMPQYKLSNYPKVSITARLSSNDSVMGSQPGDWQHSVEDVDMHQSQPIELTLKVP